MVRRGNRHETRFLQFKNMVAVLVLRVGVLLAVLAGLCLCTFGSRGRTFLAGGLLFVCL